MSMRLNFKVTNTFFRTSWSANNARDQEENTNAWTKTLCKRTLSQLIQLALLLAIA